MQSVGAATRAVATDVVEPVYLALATPAERGGWIPGTPASTVSRVRTTSPAAAAVVADDGSNLHSPWTRLRTSFLEASRKLSSGLGRIAPKKLIAYIGLGWRSQVDETASEIVDVGFFLDDEPRTSLAPFEGQSQWTQRGESIWIGGRVLRPANDALTRLERVRSEWDYRDSLDQLEILPTVSFGAVYRF